MSTRSEKIAAQIEKTCRIINRGGVIYLRGGDGWYVGAWSNIAGGEDCVKWSRRKTALEFGDLRTAHAVKRIFARRNVKVVVVYPKGNRAR